MQRLDVRKYDVSTWIYKFHVAFEFIKGSKHLEIVCDNHFEKCWLVRESVLLRSGKSSGRKVKAESDVLRGGLVRSLFLVWAALVVIKLSELNVVDYGYDVKHQIIKDRPKWSQCLGNISVWHTLLKWMSMLVTHNQDQENSDEYKYRTVLQSNKYRYERLWLETWGPLQSPSQHNTANIITQDIGTTSVQ